jgi:hypothetical protein
MKPLILAAAVAAFEFAFLASIATPPSPAPEQVASVRPQQAGTQALAQQQGPSATVSPRG